EEESDLFKVIHKKQHKKDIAQEAAKKRRHATKKPYSRSIVGATLEVIRKKEPRSLKFEMQLGKLLCVKSKRGLRKQKIYSPNPQVRIRYKFERPSERKRRYTWEEASNLFEVINRKQHKKDIAQEAAKKRRRATKKLYSRSIVGATLEVIQKKEPRSMKFEMQLGKLLYVKPKRGLRKQKMYSPNPQVRIRYKFERPGERKRSI
ncbi:hypothetical protein RYX36_013743, partial [Vicia faba]